MNSPRTLYTSGYVFESISYYVFRDIYVKKEDPSRMWTAHPMDWGFPLIKKKASWGITICLFLFADSGDFQSHLRLPIPPVQLSLMMKASFFLRPPNSSWQSLRRLSADSVVFTIFFFWFFRGLGLLPYHSPVAWMAPKFLPKAPELSPEPKKCFVLKWDFKRIWN